MKRLAVMAHFDYRGMLHQHVRRQVQALADSFDDVVVVTTASLQDEPRAWLGDRVQLIERANYGYDFFSYKVGLASRPLDGYDEVVICNDSYVFPHATYSPVLDAMRERAVDFWGFTETDRVAHHVQSFFVAFRPWVVQSQAFQGFWGAMEPISDRMKVIRQFEVGMSRHLYDAGFASAPYFVETDADRELARRRVRWWAQHRQPDGRTPRRELVRRRAAEPWNPSAALADRVLDGARLPYAKIDTLRYDPYGLGADHLLTLCEKRLPEAFDGVREFLASTAADYPPRPKERLLPTPMRLRPLAPLVRYRAPSGKASA
jgi:rhamnosyltransferase